MGRLCTKAADYEDHECNQRLTEQFIHGLDDEVKIGKVLREFIMLKDINEATSDQIWNQAQRVEEQGEQKCWTI